MERVGYSSREKLESCFALSERHHEPENGGPSLMRDGPPLHQSGQGVLLQFFTDAVCSPGINPSPSLDRP
jgi:hypothetical protein